MSDKFSTWQREILKRWQKKQGTSLSQEIKDTLSTRFDGDVRFNEPMANHSYIKIGGPADVFLIPRSLEALIFALQLASENNIPVHVHGFGANTLVRDGGVRGMVICLHNTLNHCSVLEKTDDHIDILAGAGVLFANLLHLARDLGTADLAPLTGIPGTIGGMVKMNAGTPGKEIKDVVRQITIITKDGEKKVLQREQLDFEYRELKMVRTNIIVEALLRLTDLTSPEAADSLMRQHLDTRSLKQPLEHPSLGSIFKNPVARHKNDVIVPAGQLIEEAGLKNIRLGGARISAKHANFIVNEGGAIAHDVISLMNLIRDKVKQTSGVVLDSEIRIIGEEETN